MFLDMKGIRIKILNIKNEMNLRHVKMRIEIYHDWHFEDYGCNVDPSNIKKEVTSFLFESTESEVILSKIGKGLFLIELWGGYGPHQNEFHIVDSNVEAYESFKEFIERCFDYVEENEINSAKEILEKTRVKLGV